MVWPQQRSMWGKFISVSILSKRSGAWTWTCVLCDLNLFILKSFELRPVLSSILYNFLLLLAYFVCLWIEHCGVILLMSGVRWQVLLCCIAECGDLATLSLRICQRLKWQVSFGVQREVQQCMKSILELIASWFSQSCAADSLDEFAFLI